jgi:hypothetical protein
VEGAAEKNPLMGRGYSRDHRPDCEQRESREGAYLLRTNLQAETAEGLWSKYMQLTEAEASFRALKRELSIRPLVSSIGAAREGSCDGGFPGLWALGHVEASTEAPASQRSR